MNYGSIACLLHAVREFGSLTKRWFASVPDFATLINDFWFWCARVLRRDLSARRPRSVSMKCSTDGRPKRRSQ